LESRRGSGNGQVKRRDPGRRGGQVGKEVVMGEEGGAAEQEEKEAVQQA
jgi:hypothetical protein